MILRKYFSALAVVALTALAIPAEARADAEHRELIEGSLATLNTYFAQEEWTGVKNMIGAAKAVIIVPTFTSGALIVGYERGSGVIMARHGDQWSDPAFIALSQRSIGFQAGAKQSQLLMLVMTRAAVQDLGEGVGRIGGTGGFALGNLGVGASGAGGISGGLQILTVTLSEGLAFGGGLADSSIALREELNAVAYGENFEWNGVLGKPGGGLAEAAGLRALLTEVVRESWSQ
jgi:lipid-binding SYLF domain-containing protein